MLTLKIDQNGCYYLATSYPLTSRQQVTQYFFLISAFLYHPKSDACWPAYRKGPCQDGQYLVLKSDSAIPVCENNPCSIDTYVYYNGRCEQLATIAPCRHMWPIPAALAVNAVSLNVTCEKLALQSRFGEDRPVAPAACAPGCKRSITGKCVPV